MSDLKGKLGRRTAAAAAAPNTFRKAGAEHAHRLSIDVDDATYTALRVEAARRGVTMVSIVRDLLTDYVKP